MAEFKVAELLKCVRAGISLHEPLTAEEKFSPLEVLQNEGPSPDDKVMYESVKEEIKYSMRVLNERERNILILYFGLGKLPVQSVEYIAE